MRRLEDRRLLAGGGRFVDDFTEPGLLHASFVRSPHPHARISRTDTSAARAVPGVVAVFTGDDLAAVVSPMTPTTTAPHLRPVTFEAMARDRARFVGDLVAMVVAESRYAAEDGCDEVVVDYDPLPPVATIEAALDPASPPIFDAVGSNVILDNVRAGGDVDAAFDAADRVVRRRFVQHRQSPSPMEARGGIARYSARTGELAYHGSGQGVHMKRVGLARALGLPHQRVQVLATDVGGSFGQKASLNVGREEICACAAAMLLGRPIKWIEDRRENLLAAGHARDEVVEAELALEAGGALLGIRLDLVVDSGAYPLNDFYVAPWMVGKVWETYPSAYRLDSFEMRSRVVTTNKASYVAYRGPWEIETWSRELLLDEAAHELGLDPLELRLRNAIPRSHEAYRTPSGVVLEDVTLVEALERAADAIGYAQARERQAEARAAGRLRGIGLAAHIEGNGHPGLTERVTVRIELDGTVSVLTAQVPHGQGHETTVAQLVAGELSVPLERVKLVYGDSNRVPFKVIGTGGSMAATMSTGAVLAATRSVRDQVAQALAHLREADAADVELVDGSARVRGVPGSTMRLSEIAEIVYMRPILLPAGTEPALEATTTFAWPGEQWTVSAHCAELEVDPSTGAVRFDRYVVALDCGTVINPAIVAGQIQGGVAHGVAGVLYEHAMYDGDGQYVAATFMDYLVPTAAEVPRVELVLLPEPDGDIRPRGVGETAAVVAPACVTSAIADALRPLGVGITEQYLPPSRVRQLIEAAHARSVR